MKSNLLLHKRNIGISNVRLNENIFKFVEITANIKRMGAYITFISNTSRFNDIGILESVTSATIKIDFPSHMT